MISFCDLFRALLFHFFVTFRHVSLSPFTIFVIFCLRDFSSCLFRGCGEHLGLNREEGPETFEYLSIRFLHVSWVRNSKIENHMLIMHVFKMFRHPSPCQTKYSSITKLKSFSFVILRHFLFSSFFVFVRKEHA